MSYEAIGKLHKKYETESKSATFQAREFVIEVEDGAYPQFVKFQLVQDKCSLIDDANEGDVLKVHFDLRGREWQGRYFTNLNAWRVEKGEHGGSTPPPADDAGSFPTSDDEPALEADDDLPF